VGHQTLVRSVERTVSRRKQRSPCLTSARLTA